MSKHPVPYTDSLANYGPQPAGAASLQRRPLHERIRLLGWLRWIVRSSLFHILRKLADSDDAKAIQVSNLQSLLPRRPRIRADLLAEAQPYANLGKPESRRTAADRDDVIIITARFRSGSTLLWNLFRHIDGYTAYYEPFNERRWFDPAVRGNRTDPTHRKVDDYWREYEGLENLGAYYQESWIDHDLFMDADSWNPAMKRYVELLIEHATGRPVLQFNRIDFRLPWLRQHFPRAKIVHLYRHPREQWCSSLVDPAACPRSVAMTNFGQHDHYYLRIWARDLKYHFPFLDERVIEHPYQMFYYVWKLSYLFGRCHADYSLAFEELSSNSQSCIKHMFQVLDVRNADLQSLQKLIEKPHAERWRDYADEAWFREHESRCEEVIAEFFRRGEPCTAISEPHSMRASPSS